jgi:hypothetical protein
MFACLYPGLAEIARAHGYCLAIHGSVVTDLDLVAVPWTDKAVSAEDLKNALLKHACALGYAEMIQRQVGNAKLAANIVRAEELRTGVKHDGSPELKPHGRLSWNLYLDAGIKIDLSVMPRIEFA